VKNEKKKKKKKKISSFFFANVAPLLFYFSAPGNDLLRECSLKKNDASLWDSQVRSMKSKKRSVAVEEHFGGDEEAMDSFLNQFYVDEHGRKRAVRMNRYSKKTVNGVVVEELQNWNEPKEASSGPKVVPALSVDGQNFDSLAGTPSKIGRVTGLTVVDCGLAQSTSKCTNVPTSGKWACLIERGEVTFAEKVATCVAQGASGLIMFNKVVLKEDGTEDDPEFSASLGDERAPLPVLCVKRSIGLKIKTTLLGKAATMEVPPEQASTAFLPLTNAVDQGQCGSCYLFASMAAIKMWANLLIWEEVEARGETFGPQHQMWLDTTAMAHCYQAMLRDAPTKDQAVLFVYFTGATPDGTDAQLEEKMVSILQSFAISTTDKTLPLRSAVSSFSVRSVEKDCGAGCLQVTVAIEPVRLDCARAPADEEGRRAVDRLCRHVGQDVVHRVARRGHPARDRVRRRLAPQGDSGVVPGAAGCRASRAPPRRCASSRATQTNSARGHRREAGQGTVAAQHRRATSAPSSPTARCRRRRRCCTASTRSSSRTSCSSTSRRASLARSPPTARSTWTSRRAPARWRLPTRCAR
jgi:hypothetical protein